MSIKCIFEELSRHQIVRGQVLDKDAFQKVSQDAKTINQAKLPFLLRDSGSIHNCTDPLNTSGAREL